ncbi:MAG: ABC transporter ATP-binding protein [Candidatus Sericytochromatia bacterium]
MIKTVDLYKEYENTIAVNGINLEVKNNSVYALIGPNGAGKTTLIKMIATLIEQTKGQIFVDNIENINQRKEARAKLGFLPDFFYLYDDLTVNEYLEYFCACYLLPKTIHKQRIKEVIEMVNLEIKTNEFIGSLSRGMKQRVGIAKTLLHDPVLLLLDEPASGLDPKARIDLRNIIKSLQKAGKTLVVSSHILTELSDFCDSFGIMEKGVLVKSDNINTIGLDSIHREVRIEVLNNISKTFDLIMNIENVYEPSIRDNVINFIFKGSLEEMSEINTYLVNNNIKVTSFFEKKKNIEDLFMQYSNNELN